MHPICKFLKKISLGSSMLLGALAQSDGSTLRVPGFFADKMVLQRELPVEIWGWAGEGALVSVQFAGNQVEAEARGGEWAVELPPVAKGGPFVLRIESGGDVLEFTDVVVGEVILLAGQSNARWQLLRTQSAAARTVMAQGSRPLIRQFNHAYKAENEPSSDVRGGKWIRATADEIGLFSTIGFYLAEHLQDLEADLPVGLIEAAVGGTRITSWISRETLHSDPNGKHFSDDGLAAIRSKNKNTNDPKRPSAYFNGRVAPFSGLPIRAVVWYQGESDGATYLSEHHRRAYGSYLKSLIKDWRGAWERNDLPFVIVQLPSFESEKYDYVSIREGQSTAAEAASHAGLVVTIDSGDRREIHPPDKRIAGERIALMIRSIVEGRQWEEQSPTLASVQVEEERVRLMFVNTGADGLRNTSVGVHYLVPMLRGTERSELPLAGFEVVDANDAAHEAMARLIGGNEVVVWCDDVPKPTKIRYLHKSYAKEEVSLYGSTGFPVAPFAVEIPE